VGEETLYSRRGCRAPEVLAGHHRSHSGWETSLHSSPTKPVHPSRSPNQPEEAIGKLRAHRHAAHLHLWGAELSQASALGLPRQELLA